MNDDNNKKINIINEGEESSSINLSEESEETLEIIINKTTKEATLRNLKDNRIIKLKASFTDAIEEKLEEIEDSEEEILPLTPAEFEEGIVRLKKLGLTFSVDLFPSIISKSEDLIDADEFEKIRNEFPALPREVGLVAHNTLTGTQRGLEMLGGLDNFEEKSRIVRKLVLTAEYEADFFFKHALKIPYFESIDWEVILKTHENGVKGVVSVPYALLMLTFHNTNPKFGDLDVHQNMTVAANRDLIDKMLATLTEVRAALEDSYKMRDILSKAKSLTE